VAEGLHKGLLRQVLCILSIASHMPTQGKDAVPIDFVDFAEGPCIALLAGGDEADVSLLFQITPYGTSHDLQFYSFG
jgi:hypothetical protein